MLLTAIGDAALFSGSISENRVMVGLSPIIRQELFEEARRQGIKIPELIRYILHGWSDTRRDVR